MGFRPFSERVESVLAALYIKKVYERLIERHFDDAAFFKPTGDGLVVIYPFDDDSLRDTARALRRRSRSSTPSDD